MTKAERDLTIAWAHTEDEIEQHQRRLDRIIDSGQDKGNLVGLYADYCNDYDELFFVETY